MVKFNSIDDRKMPFEGYSLHLELDHCPAGLLLSGSPTLAVQLRRPKNMADCISSQHTGLTQTDEIKLPITVFIDPKDRCGE